MKLRTTITALLVGLLVSLGVLAFGEAGLSEWLSAHLARLYSSSGLAQLPEPPVLVRGLQIGAVLLAGLSVAWVTIKVARPGRTWMFALGSALILVAASPVLALYGHFFEPLGAAAAALIAWVVAALLGNGEAGKRRRLFREQLAGRVSDAKLAELESRPFCVRLGGEARGVTALACRVLNHQKLRENLGAGSSVEVANELLDSATCYLLDAGAYLDERSADGLRCYFGLPDPDAGHADAAIVAALGLADHLQKVAAGLQDRHGERISFGQGLATGEGVLGLFGEGKFARFGALGGHLESAWKMAGANERYRSSVLVAADSYKEFGDAGEFRPIDMLQEAVGRPPVEIYELLSKGGALGEMGLMRRDAFWRGVVRMRAGDFAEAQQEFLDARAPGVEDRTLEHFLAQVGEKLARGGARV